MLCCLLLTQALTFTFPWPCGRSQHFEGKRVECLATQSRAEDNCWTTKRSPTGVKLLEQTTEFFVPSVFFILILQVTHRCSFYSFPCQAPE